jgi:hypothetical protein
VRGNGGQSSDSSSFCDSDIDAVSSTPALPAPTRTDRFLARAFHSYRLWCVPIHAPLRSPRNGIRTRWGGGRSRYSGNQALARVSLGRRVSSIFDVNGGSHAGRKDDARRHLIYMHTDRDALGETHPGEDAFGIYVLRTGGAM